MAEQTSELEQTLRNRAERLGIPFDQLREHDRDALRKSKYPTPECLDISLFDPAIVGSQQMAPQMTNEQLLATIGHVLECPMCAAQVVVYNKTATHIKKS